MTFQAGAISSNLILNLTQWNKSISKVNGQIQGLNKKIQGNKQNFQQAGRAFTVAGGVITATFGMMAKSAVTMNAEMAKVSTLLGDTTVKSVTALKGTVRDLAVKVGKDTTDIAGGMFEVVSAFGEGAAKSKKLEINAIAAAAGLSTTKDAIKLTSAVTKGFGDTSDVAVKRVTDLAFTTNKLGQTTFPELAASLGSTVPLMKTLNGTQEELFASFATLTGVTGNTSEVATQFSGILGSLIKQTPEMEKAINSLGFETSAAMVKELGLVESLRQLAGTTDGTAESMGELFRRKEALNAVLALTGAQSDVFTEKLEAMQNAGGASEEAFKKMTGGINKAGFEMTQAKIKIGIMSQKIGEQLLPIVSTLISFVGNVASKIGDFTQKFPVLSKVITIATASIGALMLVLGPLLFALPNIAAGIAMVSGALTAKLIPAVIKLTPILWAALAPFLKIAAAFAAGWVVGRTIANILNLDKHVQNLIGSFQKTQEEWDNLHRMKMGFTQEATDLIKIRRELMELGNSLGVSSGKLRVHVQAIRENEKAYNSLSPNLKEYVDTHALVVAAVEKTTEAEKTGAGNRREISDELLQLTQDLNTKIKEIVLDETEFKLFQLEQEHQARLTDLEKAGAIQIEFQLAEQLHQLEVKRVRDEARQAEEQEKQAHMKRVQDALKKAKIEEKKIEDESNKFVLQLIRDKEALELEAMKRRGEMRAAELIEVGTWEEEQLSALDTRLQNGLISFEQFLQARALLEEQARLKRDKANDDEAARDEQRRKDRLAGINNFANKWNDKIQTTIGTLSNLNDAFTDKKLSNLEAWYESEKQRINDNVTDQTQRESALENLEVQFANKKAAVEAASAKREKKLAIAGALANTAVAVTKAATSAPWPFNLPSIAFAIALGAAQLAIIGGAYNAPSLGSFAPGSGSSGGSAGGGSGGGGAPKSPGAGEGGGIPKFADGGQIAGNNLDFISGEAGAELVQKRGNLLTITPLEGGAGGAGKMVNLNINVKTVDATGFRQIIDDVILPEVRDALDDNRLTIPETSLESA
jgi:TP901 family phage tail tape measure protein